MDKERSDSPPKKKIAVAPPGMTKRTAPSTKSSTTTSVAPPSSILQPLETSFLSSGAVLEVVLSDRVGKRVKVKCKEKATIADLKKEAARTLGMKQVDRIRLQRGPDILRDAVLLEDYEILNGTALDLYYD